MLYADDTALLADSPLGLQRCLDGMFEYCKLWQLQVNVEKTKITVFESQKSAAQDAVFRYNGDILEVVPKFKYLGIILSFNGSLKPCIEYLCEQGWKAIFAILRKSRNIGLSVSSQIDLFHKLVVPVITYGCELWGYENLDAVDKLHLKFLRFVLRLKANTTVAMILGETGEVPISMYIQARMCKYFCKLTVDNHATLASKMFSLVFHMHNNSFYKVKWLKKVKGLFDSLGYLFIFNNCKSFNPKFMYELIFSGLKNNFILKWKESLISHSKCDLYSLFKVNFVQEKYLSVLPPVLAISLCRYRCCNHKLEVESLRFTRPKIERHNRKCRKCDLNEIGNEIHHLLVCPAFEDLRIRYIEKRFHEEVSVHKFLNLMSCSKRKQLVNLSLFVRSSMSQY